MILDNEAAGPIALGTGGEIASKAVATSFYPSGEPTATDLVTALLSVRFGLSEAVARVVCELSGLGGRAS